MNTGSKIPLLKELVQRGKAGVQLFFLAPALGHVAVAAADRA